MWEGKSRTVARLPILLGWLCVLPAWCTPRPIPADLIRSTVVSFLQSQEGPALSPEARLTCSEPPTAKRDPVQLRVLKMEWDRRQQSLQLRMSCTDSACLDFLVHVDLPPSERDAWRARFASVDARRAISSREVPAPGPVLVKRGQPATLVIQDREMSLTMPVICGEPGVLGARIRVFDRRTHRALYGEVVGKGMLHGEW